METFFFSKQTRLYRNETDDLFYFHDCYQHLVFRGNLMALDGAQEFGQGLWRIGGVKDSYMAVYMKVSILIFFLSGNTFLSLLPH
jgi:hypothetical protein